MASTTKKSSSKTQKTKKGLRNQWVNIYFEGIGECGLEIMAGYNAANNGLSNFFGDFNQCKLMQAQQQTQFIYDLGAYAPNDNYKTRIYASFKNISFINLVAPPIGPVPGDLLPQGDVRVQIVIDSPVTTQRNVFSRAANVIWANASFNPLLNTLLTDYLRFLQNGTIPTAHYYKVEKNDLTEQNTMFLDVRNILAIILTYQ